MNQLLQPSGPCDSTDGAAAAGDCATEPRDLTDPGARAILRAHDRHVGCRQWIAAAAYLSADLDDE
jgi:hypothetical protein